MRDQIIIRSNMLYHPLSFPSDYCWWSWGKWGRGWVIICIPLLCFNTVPAEHDSFIDMLRECGVYSIFFDELFSKFIVIIVLM